MGKNLIATDYKCIWKHIFHTFPHITQLLLTFVHYYIIYMHTYIQTIHIMYVLQTYDHFTNLSWNKCINLQCKPAESS